MHKALASLSLAAASVLVLSACSTPAADSGASGTGTGTGKVQIVTSTNVYGQIAEQIGGDRVEVTSLIASAEKDPHEYEATARDRLAVQKAHLVIENGGGYDSFMQELREGASPVVITAVEFSHDYPDAEEGEDGHDHGHDHGSHEHAEEPTEEPTEDSGDHAEHEGHEHAEEHGDHAGHDHIEGFNEHVWFDAHTMAHVVEQVAVDLGKLDPEGKASFTAAAKEITDDLAAVEGELDALHQKLEGTPVFITEPLPGLLAASAGLDDVTPDGFATAVEEGNEVAPATLLEALNLVKDGKVRAVLTNAQTGGSETDRVEEAAKTAGVPVVAFSELLEADQSYAEWMRAAISDLAAALGE